MPNHKKRYSIRPGQVNSHAVYRHRPHASGYARMEFHNRYFRSKYSNRAVTFSLIEQPAVHC